MSNIDIKSTGIVVALLALAGTIIAALFGFFGSTEPIRIPLEATQTAAAQFTAIAQTSSVSAMATTMVPASTDEPTAIVPTSTDVSTSTATSTDVPTSTATPTESPTPSITPTATPEPSIGNWIILVGGAFKSSEDARDFVSEKPYSDYAAQVFQKDGFYRSVLVGFASERYASEALRKIFDKGGRGEVRGLTKWCKNPVAQSGYTLCK